MKRRAFITLLGGAAAITWPLGARAQQPLPTIGFLSPTSADTNAEYLRAFRQALEQTGENQMDRLQTLAADLVRLRVAVIVAGAQPAAFAAKAVTISPQLGDGRVAIATLIRSVHKTCRPQQAERETDPGRGVPCPARDGISLLGSAAN